MHDRYSSHRVVRFAIKFAFGKVIFASKVAFGKVILAEGRGKGGGLELGDKVVQVAASVVGDVALGVKLYAPER